MGYVSIINNWERMINITSLGYLTNNYPAKSRSISQGSFYYSSNYQRNEFYSLKQRGYAAFVCISQDIC